MIKRSLRERLDLGGSKTTRGNEKNMCFFKMET